MHPFLSHIFCTLALLFCGQFSSVESSDFSETHYSDCENSQEICELKSYHFSFEDGYGAHKEILSDDKSIEETNSLWLRLAVEKEGKLEFLIVPDALNDDIDFVVYESSDHAKSCEYKVAMRTMTSGKTIGWKSESCLGNTGLRKESFDTKESKGCYQADDNFLAPLFLSSNKEYFILINNYNSNSGFNILFTGEDGLQLKNNCQKLDENISFELYPNPTTDLIYVKPLTEYKSEVRIEMIDVLGQILYQTEYEEFIGEKEIDTSNLTAGQYIIRMGINDNILVKSFVKK